MWTRGSYTSLRPKRALDLGNAGGNRARRLQPVRQIHARSLWSQSPQCLSSSGTGPRDHRHGHNPRSVPGGSTMNCSGENTISPSFLLFCELRSPDMFLSITLFWFIFIHNKLVQTYILWKLIDIFPVPLLGKGQAERRALFPGGRTARRASDLRERALDLIGKEEDRGSPVFIPNIRSICDSYEHSHYRSASAEAGQVLRGTLVKTSSSKRVFPPRAKHMQWKPFIMWAVAPLESRLCMLHSQSDHRTNCV